ncbi:hypothetical protein OK016_27375 [Vibrio chagasii]|nr:hypothetical protein [Vibrio chagasii]
MKSQGYRCAPEVVCSDSTPSIPTRQQQSLMTAAFRDEMVREELVNYQAFQASNPPVFLIDALSIHTATAWQRSTAYSRFPC